uniref:Transposase IS204/IS1001/IS1096/IS1165 zinc-finger domain-containing protein n=1 Tax=Chlorobium chlorochromatii (strain CaD3) TaxID=340177 RepID=Q3ATZ6_CHLCH
MKDTVLFQQALCLPAPWFVKSSAFDIEQKRLTIQLDFQKGSTFSCPTCGQHDLKAYDTAEKQWRHLTSNDVVNGISILCTIPSPLINLAKNFAERCNSCKLFLLRSSVVETDDCLTSNTDCEILLSSEHRHNREKLRDCLLLYAIEPTNHFPHNAIPRFYAKPRNICHALYCSVLKAHYGKRNNTPYSPPLTVNTLKGQSREMV